MYIQIHARGSIEALNVQALDSLSYLLIGFFVFPSRLYVFSVGWVVVRSPTRICPLIFLRVDAFSNYWLYPTWP